METGVLQLKIKEMAFIAVTVASFLLLLALVYFGGKTLILGAFGTRIKKLASAGAQRRLETAVKLLVNIWKYFVLLLALLILASLFRGVTIPAVALTAVFASTLGFGAQSFLRDIIAGFSIIFEGQFAVGDNVKLLGLDISGKIEEVGLRVTILLDDDNNHIYVPNGEIKAVINKGHKRQGMTFDSQEK